MSIGKNIALLRRAKGLTQAERDVSCGSDVRFAREVCLRHVVWNTSHHCERGEQHHYAKHNFTLAQPKLH